LSRLTRDEAALPAVEALDRVSTTEQALRALRCAIVDGRIKQGDQLREIQLARLLGTGRGTVREALRHLVQEGLAEHEVNRGIFVRRFALDDVLDVYLAREAVELAAVEILLERPVPPELGQLRACVKLMAETAAAGGTWRDVADLDITFHETLVELAGSPRLARMYATLAAESRMHLYAYPPYSTAQSVADHEQMVDALETGGASAQGLLREHLRYSAALAADWRRDAAT
jgi:DNA-binding GntR family transcriptional regulator